MVKTRNPLTRLDTHHGSLEFGGRCRVMGILNVTPDSFSDGGRFVDASAAVARALGIEAEGADVLDIGGESTRPGSLGVEATEQVRRVVPVVREARARGLRIPISIDTRSAKVAEAALDVGADMVNDVSGLRDDPDMIALVRERGVPFIVMHMQGTPATMQANPCYQDVVREIRAFFLQRAEALDAEGVDTSRMIVDPGIGFGKTMEHNVELVRRVAEFKAPQPVQSSAAVPAAWPVLIGPSRKRFIGELMSGRSAEQAGVKDSDREAGTAAVVAWCVLAGVEMVRVHDVRTMRGVVTMLANTGR
ncbi:MAG: dihydropteroate synthase [Planctomycetia bacterium]|nr:MAG: dihydropteroate synthase [Planctomycetia bacterium]RIK70350.1 MAG: dihydropteroate synthase [Planctomycetota bacterium]